MFWWTVAGLTLSAGWIEVLGLSSLTSRGGAVDTINTVLSVALLRPAGDGRDRDRDDRRQRNERLHRLALLQAAGIRVPRVYSALVVAVLGFFFTLYLNIGDLLLKFKNYLLFVIYWVTPWAASSWPTGGCAGPADVSRLVNFARLPWGRSPCWPCSWASSSRCRLGRRSSARRSPTPPACRSTRSRRPALRRHRLLRRLHRILAVYYSGYARRSPGGGRTRPEQSSARSDPQEADWQDP